MTEEDDRKLALRLSGQSEHTFSHDPASIIPKSEPISLKLCPFCGKQVTLHATEPLSYSPYIRCGCNAEIWGEDTEDVIEKWNKRVEE